MQVTQLLAYAESQGKSGELNSCFHPRGICHHFSLGRANAPAGRLSRTNLDDAQDSNVYSWFTTCSNLDIYL